MSWLSTPGEGVVISKDTTKACIGQQRVDYDSPPETVNQYHIHGTVLFFGVTERTVTEYRGLTYSAALAMVNATGAQASVFAVYKKAFPGTVFYAEMLVEESSKTTSLRRADASGQYVVTVTETSTTLPDAIKVTWVG